MCIERISMARQVSLAYRGADPTCPWWWRAMMPVLERLTWAPCPLIRNEVLSAVLHLVPQAVRPYRGNRSGRRSCTHADTGCFYHRSWGNTFRRLDDPHLHASRRSLRHAGRRGPCQGLFGPVPRTGCSPAVREGSLSSFLPLPRPWCIHQDPDLPLHRALEDEREDGLPLRGRSPLDGAGVPAGVRGVRGGHGERRAGIGRSLRRAGCTSSSWR